MSAGFRRGDRGGGHQLPHLADGVGSQTVVVEVIGHAFGILPRAPPRAARLRAAILVALGIPRGDPIVGLAITLVILKITWDSWKTASASNCG